jgi:hypothetical protein
MDYRHPLALLILGCVVCQAACARNGLGSEEVSASGADAEDQTPGRDGGAVDEVELDDDAEEDDTPGAPPDDLPPQECAVLEAEDTLSRVPVDIVWVVDDSGSMGDEQARVRENIANFADQIGSDSIDVRVVFVTEEDLALGTTLEGKDSYLFVEADVGSNDSLEVLLEDFPAYQGHLRAEAQTHFVALTDDESDLAAEAFRTAMETRLGHGFVFHAIASENVGGEACTCPGGPILGCGAAAPGDQYYALAASTGGEQVSICTVDWGAVFDRLAKAVVSGAPLPCSFALPAAPNGEQLDAERVKFDYVPAAGSATEIPRLGAVDCGILVAWRYDDDAAPTTIELCPRACESLSAGGRVRIALGCAPTVVVE